MYTAGYITVGSRLHYHSLLWLVFNCRQPISCIIHSMSFEVPSPYVWDDSFRVAYDNLDSEHQALFKCIAKCAENRADAAALADLVKVTVDHFADEERMMAKTNFSGLPEHNKIHSEFVAKIKSLSAPLDDATVAFAKQWLVNHIKGIDFKYKGNL